MASSPPRDFVFAPPNVDIDSSTRAMGYIFFGILITFVGMSLWQSPSFKTRARALVEKYFPFLSDVASREKRASEFLKEVGGVQNGGADAKQKKFSHKKAPRVTTTITATEKKEALGRVSETNAASEVDDLLLLGALSSGTGDAATASAPLGKAASRSVVVVEGKFDPRAMADEIESVSWNTSQSPVLSDDQFTVVERGSRKKKAVHRATNTPSPITPAVKTRHVSIKESPLPSPVSENIPTVQTPVSLDTISHKTNQHKPHDSAETGTANTNGYVAQSTLHVPTRTLSEPAPFRASDVATVTQDVYDDLFLRFHDLQEKCTVLEDSNRVLARSLVEAQTAAKRIGELDARARSVEAENAQLRAYIRSEGYPNSDARSPVSPRSISPMSTIPPANIATDNARLQAQVARLEALLAQTRTQYASMVKEKETLAARLGMISEDLDTVRAGAQADLEELLQERARGDEERLRLGSEIELAIEETERVRALWASDKLRLETELGELRHRLQTALDAGSEKRNLSASLERSTAESSRLRSELEAHHKTSNSERERLEAELQLALADKRRLEGDLTTATEHIDVLASKVQSFVDNERLLDDKIADLESRSVVEAPSQIPPVLEDDATLNVIKENAIHLREVIAGQRSVVGLLSASLESANAQITQSLKQREAQARATSVTPPTVPETSRNNAEVAYAEALAGQNAIIVAMSRNIEGLQQREPQLQSQLEKLSHEAFSVQSTPSQDKALESAKARNASDAEVIAGQRSIIATLSGSIEASVHSEKRLQQQLVQKRDASQSDEIGELKALAVANTEALAGQRAVIFALSGTLEAHVRSEEQLQQKLANVATLEATPGTISLESEKSMLALKDRARIDAEVIAGQWSTISQLASFVADAAESRSREKRDSVKSSGVTPQGDELKKVSRTQQCAIQSAEVAAGQQYLIAALAERIDAFVAAPAAN
ncbi:hypothetical protein BJ742DRAFT_737277 [Cladochytrium replicatum]|nr:hypothetical protein BJ742DRAFT_737277 [Cladochytrium replicatum]